MPATNGPVGAHTGAATASPLTLELAGVGVSLCTQDPAWLPALAERYRGFLTRTKATFAIELITDPAAGKGEPPPNATRGWAREDGDEAFAVAVPGVEVGADLRLGHGWVRSTPGSAGIDVLLRHLLPGLVRDGLVLHGAGIADGGGGWACCGASGTGKSTLAALFPERALCDELVAVRCTAGGFVLESLPFWRARPCSLPLRGICCLRQAPAHGRTRLDPGTAARRLARIGLWPSYSRRAMLRTFAAFARLVDRCPVYDLAFAPRSDVWRTLTGEPHENE
jgi:hypothetical protein